MPDTERHVQAALPDILLKKKDLLALFRKNSMPSKVEV